MEVKAGYKQTEIGVLPEDWQIRSVQDIAQIKTGPFGTMLKASEYSTGAGVPLISVGDIRAGLLQITNRTPRVEAAVVRRLPQYVLRHGDIVFARKGGVERSAIVKRDQEGWMLGSDGINIRTTKNIHQAYLALQFQSDRIQQWLLNNAIGTTMPSLNQQILGRVLVPFPPTLNEQKAIAVALSDTDASLRALDELHAKKRAIKQAAMQQLLTGKTRLPWFAGEWQEKPLSELAWATKGTQLDSAKTSSTGTFAHLNGGINPSGYTENANTNANTIAISEGGNSCGYVQFMAEPYWCGGHCYSVVPKGIDNRFLYHALKAKQSSIMEMRVGSGLPNIQKSALLAFHLCYPNAAEEQAAIAAVLSDMDAEITAVQQTRDKTRAVRQGMMQELLTGRTRLV